MKIRGKKEDKEEVVEKEGEEKEVKKKKKPEIEGSRWTALVLLIMTLIMGLWFYIQGTGGWQAVISGILELVSGFGGSSTYVIEN